MGDLALLRCVRAEKMKIRHSMVWLFFLVVPVLPAIMGTGNYMMNTEILKSEWYSLWTQHTLFYSNFFYGPLIGIYCSYLWRLEHLNYNWNHCMTAPVPVECVFLSKLIQVCRMTLFTQLWTWILYFLCGKYAGLPGLPPVDMLIWLFRGAFGGMAAAALQLVLSMKIRSFALPVGIGLAGSIGGLLLSNGGYGLFWPYSLMMLGMNANKNEDVLSTQLVQFAAACIFFISLFSCAGIRMLKRQDVRAA